MKNAIINRGIIKKIAKALAELNEQVVYVGGATVGMYINDPAAEDVRPTKDVDISLSIATLSELEKIREELNRKGFTQIAEDNVICRFRYEDVKVDVMNTRSIGWAPANPWFESGFEKKEEVDIDEIKIQLLPFAYFLATKFAAYNDRGNNEPRTSHDFEDIIYILDNQTMVNKLVENADNAVKNFIKTEFEKIINDKIKQEAILGNLFYETREERFEMIMEKLKAIVKTI